MAEDESPLGALSGFEWDEGNARKNWERHEITQEEAENIFFNEPLIVGTNSSQAKGEKRYYALGQTSEGGLHFAVFTMRASLLRVISVRDMSRNERRIYAKH